jgi:hypothetical protein
MLIRVSSLSSGGRSLAYSTVTKLADEVIHGLRPLMGVNLVAGLTGSGKTLLGEALWVGVAHAIHALLRDERYFNALQAAIDAYAIRPLTFKLMACFREVEVGRELCIEVDVKDSRKADVKPPAELSGELRVRALYGLLHIISVPDRVKWGVAHALWELREVGLLKFVTDTSLPRETCLATITLLPPVGFDFAGERHRPCYMHMLGVSPEAIYESEAKNWKVRIFTHISNGELNEALFKTVNTVAVELSKLTREENIVSVLPLIYLDDGFEGLDIGRIKRLLEGSFDVSIYVTSHRIEAGMYTTRNFVLSYGTRASELVEQPRDFRFALVDAGLIERHSDIFKDVCKALIDAECK